MKKILVVGSKGFIGSHTLLNFTTIDDFEVWGCDVINDYNAENYFVIDASNSDFEELFQQKDFDFCVNCSGSASVQDSLIHPLRDYYLNAVNVFKLLEAIRKYTPTCKFINISSAAVYGNPGKLPIVENAELQPLSPYGIHKLQAEQTCEAFYKFYQINTCSLRIFSAYGRGLKKQLFWDIGQKSVNSKEIILFGSGNESRDFIHVLDIVQAVEVVVKNAEYNGTVYNVANSVEVTVVHAADKLLNSLGWKGRLAFNSQQRKGDPLNWQADIRKLKALGYQQKITIEEGLNDYAKWLLEEKLV